MVELSSIHLQMFGFFTALHKPSTNIIHLHIHTGYVDMEIICGKFTNMYHDYINQMKRFKFKAIK